MRCKSSIHAKSMREYAAPHGPPAIRTCTYATHSFSKGMDVLLLLFCTMLAWFLREMRMREGASRQGSPSTCMGIDLYVKRVTSRHWCNLSPWPPTWRAACKKKTNKNPQTNNTPSREKERDLRTEIAEAVNESKMLLCWQHPLHNTPYLHYSKRAQWKCVFTPNCQAILKIS